jgi:regulator of sirC expression with transglutaminase-like and TPR domain
MNLASPTLPAETLPEAQRRALISLLADEDPAIYELVRMRLVSFGAPAREWLRPHALAGDPLFRRRVQEILHCLDRETADEQFRRFCEQPPGAMDLETGIWLLVRTRYPEASPEAYRALLDSYAAELRPRTHPASHAEANLLAINQHLFQRLGFHGNEENYYDPENSYLNRVLDQRRGNPISLCTLYMLVAQRLAVPVAGIGLPGHFLCRYLSPGCEIYIDCFNHGRFLTRTDCLRFLSQSRCSPNAGQFTPVPAGRMLLRMCRNLHQVALRTEEAAEAARFQRYLALLGR